MKRKPGLGRGLDALLPAGPPEVALEGGAGLKEVPLDAIVPNPRQPRRSFEDDAEEELASSIRELGVLQPLLVRETGDATYELIAGERRLRAARRAGRATVPVLVLETDERGSLERALVENVHRQDLNPIEEAAAYRELMDEGGLTQEALGRRLAKNRVTIANSLRLLDLPVKVQRYLIEGRLTAGHGRALLALQGNPFMERLARRAAEEGLSVRETEDLARRYQLIAEPSGRSRAGPAPPPIAAEAERALADHLQTRVRVELGKKKGKISIEFVSLDELERLVELIAGGAPGGTTRTARPD